MGWLAPLVQDSAHMTKMVFPVITEDDDVLPEDSVWPPSLEGKGQMYAKKSWGRYCSQSGSTEAVNMAFTIQSLTQCQKP